MHVSIQSTFSSCRSCARTCLANRHPGHSRRPSTRLRSLETAGVQGLLQRDRRPSDLSVDEEAFYFEPSQAELGQQAELEQAGAQQEEQQDEEQAGASSSAASPPAAASSSGKPVLPKRSRQAIDAGMERFAVGDYRGAIELFQLALELPGSGVMRAAGSPKEYACASEGEEQAALFNMACCYARLGERPAALTCVEACLDAGFKDLQALRSDPDLQHLRGPELDALLSKRSSALARLLGGLGRK